MEGFVKLAIVMKVVLHLGNGDVRRVIDLPSGHFKHIRDGNVRGRIRGRRVIV
jgi:hypothetical protein